MKRVLAVLVGAGLAVGGGAAAWAGTAGAGGPKREAVRECIATAKERHPDDKAAARAAARTCVADAGVVPGRKRARMAEARECLAEVREDHPNATKRELRKLVKECVAAD